MKSKFRPRFRASAFPLAIAFACGGSAFADNLWDGEGSSPFNWSDNTNWGGNTAPGYGTLTFSGSVGTTNTVDASASQNVLLWTGSSAWTLNNSGGAIVSLYDDGGIQAKIENQSSGLVTINAPIDFAATAGTNRGEINAVNGDITFGTGGTITVSGSAVNELHFYGSGRTVTINSVLTAGARKLVIGPGTSDNNTVILNAANVYSGNTEVNVGTVQVGNNTGFGTSAVYLGNGGSSYANLDSSLLLNTSGLTVANAITTNKADTGGGLGTGIRTIGGNFTSGNSTFSGSLTLNGGAVLTAGNGGTVTFSGNIVNGSDTGNVSRDLSVTGTGATVVLSGTGNTYTGKTSVTGGATLSINADARLGTAPGSAVADQLTLDGGSLKITAAGQTLAATRGITLGASGGTIDTSTISGSAITTTIGGVIAGNGPLTLKSTGNLSANGGGDGGLGIKLNQASNTFTGDIIITSGLVSYASNGSFGNASNKIILNGGGLLDPNTNIALSRNIEVQAGGATFRSYGSNNATWAGTLTGSGNINRTDGGTLTHSGDVSGFGGTYNVQGGTTQLTGTAATIGGNWTVAGGTSLTVNSTAAQTLAGSVTGTGTLLVTSTGGLTLTGSTNLGTGIIRVNGSGVATFGSGASVNADQIAFTGTTNNQLNIAGATVTTKYINLGDAGSNSGRVNQTAGSVTVASGGSGMRIGHWDNGVNAGSVYNISGGTLDSTAVLTTVSWDGDGQVNVGGGAGAALWKAGAINFDGGGGDTRVGKVTVLSNGTLEAGGAIGGSNSGAALEGLHLDGGTVKATASATWSPTLFADSASTLDANGFNVTLTNNITGTGSINLSSATGSLIFNTGGTQTVSAGLNGSTAITKTGTGTITLSGTGTHSGTIAVSDGRLNLTGGTASDITVASGKNLGGEGTTTGSLTLSGSNNLYLDPTTSGKLTVGNLTLTGTNTIQLEKVPGVGAFNVLTYTGSLTGSFGTNLVYDTANTAKYRTAPTFTDTSGVVTLDLGTKNLTWNGTSGGQWDLLTSARWNVSEVDQFAWGDAVTFDDSGVATTVTITGELRPSSIAVTGTQNYTIHGSSGNFISGIGTLTKSGASTLTLSGPNTFSGGTTISEGAVVATVNASGNPLGSGTVGIASGALVRLDNTNVSGSTVTLGNIFTGAGELNLQFAAGATARNTVMNNVTGFSGTIRLSSLGANGDKWGIGGIGTVAGSLIIESGSQLYVSAGTNTFSGINVAGSGNTENRGAIRLGGTLGGNVTLADNTTLGAEGGTLSGNITSGAAGTQTLTFGGAANGNATLSGNIGGGTGTIALAQSTTGVVTLSGTNTYTGATTVSAGLLRLNSANAAPGGIGATGGTSNISLTGGLLGLGNGNFSRNTGTGVDQVELTNASGFAAFTADRTVNFGGAAATVTWGSAGFNPSTLVLSHSTATHNLLIANPINLGSEARTVQVNDGTGTIDGRFSAALSGTGSLIKTGAGTLALAVNSSYTGGTTINGGVLDLVGGGGATGTIRGVVNVSSGATLRLSTGDATGYNTGSDRVSTINLNGGTLNVNTTANQTLGSAVINMTGATISGIASSNLDFFAGSSAINTLASATASTVSGAKINMRQNGGLVITVADGAAANDLTVSSVISNSTGFTNNNLTKAGAGNLVLSGANTFSTGTNINGGTLTLDYTAASSRLADGAALTFGAGTSVLALSGGTAYTEVVASTTLSAGASANITRPSGTSVIQLGTITVGANSTLNLAASGIATTNNTNTNGMLGPWATVGTDWAMNSTNAANGPITAYTGYINYTRLSSGTKAIANNAADNARIQEGTGTAASLTLAAATTHINTLNQTATGGATTIDMGSNTLRFGSSGGVLAGPGVSALTIGSSVNQGFLSAGGSTIDIAGTLTVTNNSSNTITINSPVINNGTGAVTLVKSGSGLVTLAGNTGGTYSGGTVVNQGELRVSTPNTAGTYTTLGTGAVTANSGTTLRFTTGSHANNLTFANALNLNSATLINEDGSHILSGAVALTGSNTINGIYSGKNLTLSGVVSGAGSLTKTGSASLILTNINTYTGGTTLTGGTLTLGNGGANGVIRGTVTVNSGTTLNYSAQNAFGYTSGTSVNVLNINGGTVGNAGFGNHFWNNFQLNMTAGTLNLGTHASQVTNDWHSPTVTTSASATTATIAAADAAAVMRLRDNTHATFNVADGAAAIDLSITAAITQSGGTSNITKTGAGLMQISGVNAYTGTTTISGGSLRISGAGSLNSGNYVANITNNGVLEFTSSAAQTLGGIISGSGSITKSTGTGTLILSGNNSYTGNTTINAGRLSLAGTNASGLVINSGATLTSSGSTTGGLTTNAGSTIALNGITPATGLSAGAVNFAGATALVFDALPALGSTTHTVVNYTSLGGYANLAAPVGYRAALNNNTGINRVELAVTTGTRTWNRTDAGSWNILSATSWLEDDDMFATGDAVVFDDTATNGSVTLSGTLNPSSVTFNNTATTYALTGSGAIAGTVGLAKNGSGSVSIATNNPYTGATAINAGTLNIQHANALGATTSGTTVASGAALEIQGGITAAEGLTIAGTGISSGGAIRNISGTNTLSGAVSLTGAASVVSASGGLTLSGAVTSASGTQTLTIGGGSITMSGANNTVDIVVNNGTLFARGGAWAASFAANRTITINSGGILDTATHTLGGLGGATRPANIVVNEDGIWKLNNEQQLPNAALTLTAGIVNGPGEIRGGGTIATGAHATKSSVINAPISLGNGAVTFNVANGSVDTDLSITAAIAGGNGITKTGAGTMQLSAANTYAGNTTISGGTVTLTGTGGIYTNATKAAANSIVINGGAVLQGDRWGWAANQSLGQLNFNSGYIAVDNGTIRNSAAASTDFNNRGINIGAGGITYENATSATTWTINGGSNANSYANNAAVTLAGTGNGSFEQTITGTGVAVVKTGAGTWTLTGANSYTGDTSVNDGILRINGNHSGTGLVSVASGATLGGTGSISGAVNVTGVLSPGASIESLATGTLSFITGSSLFYEASFADSNFADLLDVTGDFNLAGIVTLDLTDADLANSGWVIGTKLAIASYTGSWNNGTFDGFADASTHLFGLNEWQIAYADSTQGENFTAEQSGSFVTLTLVPEPSSMLLGGIGSLLLLRRRRR